MHKGEHSSWRRRRQLTDRTRVILLICSVVVSAFTVREVFEGWDALGGRFAVRIVGLALALFGLWVAARAWAIRHAWSLAIGIVATAYVLTALAGVVSPTHEYVTTAMLFVGAALVTATVLPWGLGPQSATVAIGVVTLMAAVWWKDGSWQVVASDPGVAVVMAFALSLVTAREFHRYRVAHWREAQQRARAEAVVRRMNARLEWRVADRTAALQRANQRLEEEIAERRRAAEALRASQVLLSDTVDNSTAIVSLKDRDGRYLLVNREFERLFGRPRATVVGRTDEELFPAPLADKLGARDGEVLRGGVPVSFEQDLSVGSVRRAYVCVKFPLRGADEAYGVGSMATDITVLKWLQEELRQHQDELAHVLRLHTIGEMAAALAHEINQPLCAITNYAQGGAHRLRGGATDVPALLEAFEQIAGEGLRAGQILRSIRTLVRRESTDAGAVVDVETLAGEAVRVLEPQARLHGVTVRLERGGDLPPVHANATQIEQVMVNLMLNGVQSIADAPGARREVVVSTAYSGDSVEVAVSDTGGGISPAMEQKLFTPFVTSKARGLGLGLAISRSIIENHGGRLWATANSSAGATFRFSLPITAERSA